MFRGAGFACGSCLFLNKLRRVRRFDFATDSTVSRPHDRSEEPNVRLNPLISPINDRYDWGRMYWGIVPQMAECKSGVATDSHRIGRRRRVPRSGPAHQTASSACCCVPQDAQVQPDCASSHVRDSALDLSWPVRAVCGEHFVAPLRLAPRTVLNFLARQKSRALAGVRAIFGLFPSHSIGRRTP